MNIIINKLIVNMTRVSPNRAGLIDYFSPGWGDYKPIYREIRLILLKSGDLIV